jgi:pimeloyl-ACP methyl ester carboxylesterase
LHWTFETAMEKLTVLRQAVLQLFKIYLSTDIRLCVGLVAASLSAIGCSSYNKPGNPIFATSNSPYSAITVEGHGPVVVLQSGGGDAQGSWSSVTRDLAQCFTVVTFDRSSAEHAPAAEVPRKPVLAVDVANRLLEQLRAKGLFGPYILVGHSLAGIYVQAFARNHPDSVAGIVLVDASSPLEPPGVFVSKVPPKSGTVDAAEEAGVAPSNAALLSGPPLPPVPLMVIVATDHQDTPQREALWRDVQQRTAAQSLSGHLLVAKSGHFIQAERPDIVVDAILQVAAASGVDTVACHR